MAQPRERCLGITRQYERCINRSAPGDGEFCRIHRRVENAAGPRVPGNCIHICSNKLRCAQVEHAEGTGQCAYHKRLQERQIRIRNGILRRVRQEQERIQLFTAQFMAILLDVEVRDVIVVVNRMFLEGQMTGWERISVIRNLIRLNYEIKIPLEERPDFPDYQTELIVWSTQHLAQLQWDIHRERQNAWQHPDADQRDLARLANDRQSVHTSIVSEQTNKGVTALMSFAIPEGQNTMVELEGAWASYILEKPDQGRIVLQDMGRWYGLATCREQNDWLFKKVADHLWAYIKTSDHKIELVKRFWQESVDAVGMCCDGHINRLVNVLVGFHPAFEPQVSIKERLQEGMSKIAADETLSDEQKVERAEALMKELNIPEEEQAVWMEAL